MRNSATGVCAIVERAASISEPAVLPPGDDESLSTLNSDNQPRIALLTRSVEPLVDVPLSASHLTVQGDNVLAAFLAWEPDGFENAIVISERLMREDRFSSVQVQWHEIDCRDTGSNIEEITRDLPNQSGERVNSLSEDGIVEVGTVVSGYDILVGKISFDIGSMWKVRDFSLRVPPGESGCVVKVKVLTKSVVPDLPPGVKKRVQVAIAQKRKLCVGDKMAGRYGDTGVVVEIMPEEDMPFLEDGTPVDIILPPSGMDSKLALEAKLGWAAYRLGLTHMVSDYADKRVEAVLACAWLMDQAWRETREKALCKFKELAVPSRFVDDDDEVMKHYLVYEFLGPKGYDSGLLFTDKIYARRSVLREWLKVQGYDPKPVFAFIDDVQIGRGQDSLDHRVLEIGLREWIKRHDSKRSGGTLNLSTEDELPTLAERVSKHSGWPLPTSGRMKLYNGKTGEDISPPPLVGIVYLFKLLVPFNPDGQVPLRALGLPVNTYRALVEQGITTVAQLASMDEQELRRVRELGSDSLVGIRNRLMFFLKACPTTPYAFGESISPSLLSYQGSYSDDELLNTPISALGLSDRSYRALIQNGIETIEQIKSMSYEEVCDLRGVGNKPANEILRKCQDFFLSQPPVPIVKKEVVDYSLVRGIPLDKISVNRLSLPESELQLLEKAGIETIEELASQSVSRWETHEAVVQSLHNYLRWLSGQGRSAWEREVMGEGISPLYRGVLTGASLHLLIDQWLSLLTERKRQIIYWRYGIGGERLTLEEIGKQLGLTRERVRQLQKQAVNTLKRSLSSFDALPLALKALFDYLLREAGGLISETQLSFAVEALVSAGGVDPASVARLIFDLDDDVVWLNMIKSWGMTRYPLGKIIEIHYIIRDLLEKSREPVSIRELLERFRNTPFYRQHAQKLGVRFIIACFRTHPDMEITHDGRCVLRNQKRVSVCTNLIISALRELGEPSHYSVLTRRVNLALPAAQRVSKRYVHALLGRRSDLFVRVGHGIFGLAEWGLPNDGNLANAAYRVLRDAGKPLPMGIISEQVLKTWRVNSASVSAAVDGDERFVNLGHGVYGLREWTSGGSGKREAAGFGELFGDRLSRWLDEWNRNEMKKHQDTHAEVDAIRKIGLDFFEK